MNTFELWKSGALDVAITKKIVKSSVLEYCKIYEKYRKEKEKKRYEEAIESTADLCCTSSRTVKRAITLVTK